MEHRGVPINRRKFEQINENWDLLKAHFVKRTDPAGQVYEGTTFKTANWKAKMEREWVDWPLKVSGELDLQDETFKEMAQLYPRLEPWRQLRSTLSQLRLSDLVIGRDGRNRVSLMPYRSKTGRCQPSNSKFIFGTASWLRNLIEPEPGKALLHFDYSQQELAVAAALSQDPAMIAAYESGDAYVGFGRQIGLIPTGGTGASHPREREQSKRCSLGVLFGMTAWGLARRIQQPVFTGRELLEAHQRIYPTFWKWSDAAEHFGMLHNYTDTVLGWRMHVTEETKGRTLRNYPMQSNGSEMLRTACCYAYDRGVALAAPIHDALLVESDIDAVEETRATVLDCMRKASEVILDGFALRTGYEVIVPPGHYEEERGRQLWQMCWEALEGHPAPAD
jgi:hypothetical protein